MSNYEFDLIEKLSPISDERLAEIASLEIVRDLLDETIAEGGIPIGRLPAARTLGSARRGRISVAHQPRARILAAMVVAGVVAFASIALATNGTPLLFPRGVSTAAAKTGTTSHRAWRLASMITHQALAEGALSAAPASMLSCPTETQCYAVSDPPITRFGNVHDYLMDLGPGSVGVSSDGGNSWTNEPLPAGVVLTTPLVCQGASDCTAGAVLLQGGQTIAQVAPEDTSTQIGLLLGANGQASPANCSVEGNVGLSEDQTLAALADFSSIVSAVLAAPTTNSCASSIATQVRFTIAYAGSSLLGAEGLPPLLSSGPVMSSASIDPVEQSLQSMTLYGTSDATAALESTTDGGATWSTVPLPSDTGPLLSLTCPTSSTCMGIALTTTSLSGELPWTITPSHGNVDPVEFIETVDDGANWTTSSFPGSSDAPYSLTCSDASTCLAVGSVIGANGGLSYAQEGLVLQTTDGGSTWGSATIPSGLEVVGQATCPSPTACFAIGDTASAPVVLSSIDGGSTWTMLSVPSTVSSITSISCATPTNCSLSGRLPGGVNFGRGAGPGGSFVAGPNGDYSPVDGPGSGPAMIASTTDGGSAWSIQSFGWREANGNQLVATEQVVCSPSDACVAIGGSSGFSTPVLTGSS
ncbi:MAG TPA: hypothetical protein VIJ34_06220 [Acidimicrobiales bacterium]